MADRLPQANSQLEKLTDSQLAVYAQATVNGMGSAEGLIKFDSYYTTSYYTDYY